MKVQTVEQIFELAGYEVHRLIQIQNKYWPEHPNYDEMRRAYPWWEVTTEEGDFIIGWRKRVIEISWKGTPRRGIVTQDDVTKSDSMVHAYSYGDAVKYLSKVKELTMVGVIHEGHHEFTSRGFNDIIRDISIIHSGKTAVEGVVDEVEAALLVLNVLNEQGNIQEVPTMTVNTVSNRNGDDYYVKLHIGRMELILHPEKK